MKQHFLETINIVNFKCFHDFEVTGLQRVNLISGKNNIGKTAFMEACYINVEAINIKNFVAALASIKVMRENLNILTNRKLFDVKKFMERSNDLDVLSNINKASFRIVEEEGKKLYDFNFNKQHARVNVNEFSFDIEESDNIQFIDSFGLTNQTIIVNYASVQKKEKEDFLNTVLNEFDSTIESFKVIGDMPQCKIGGEWLELTELGDGARHIVSIITSLFQAENGYLFIDELENGIHYTHLDKVWDVILKVSKEVNCQVFVTTHSKECIEAFNRQNIENEGAYLEFYRSKKNNTINVKKRDKEQLAYSLSHDGEFRGE